MLECGLSTEISRPDGDAAQVQQVSPYPREWNLRSWKLMIAPLCGAVPKIFNPPNLLHPLSLRTRAILAPMQRSHLYRSIRCNQSLRLSPPLRRSEGFPLQNAEGDADRSRKPASPSSIISPPPWYRRHLFKQALLPIKNANPCRPIGFVPKKK